MCNIDSYASGCISADAFVMQKYRAAKYQRKHTSLLQLHDQPYMDHGAVHAPCTSVNKFTMLSVHINLRVISVHDSHAYKVCKKGLQNLLKKCKPLATGIDNTDSATQRCWIAYKCQYYQSWLYSSRLISWVEGTQNEVFCLSLWSKDKKVLSCKHIDERMRRTAMLSF